MGTYYLYNINILYLNQMFYSGKWNEQFISLNIPGGSFIINKTKYLFFPWVGNISLHFETLFKKPCFISSCEIPDLVTLRITACLALHLMSFRIIQRAESSGLQSKPFERKGEKVKSSGSLGYIPPPFF